MRLVTADKAWGQKVGQVSSTRAKWRNMARFCLSSPGLAQPRRNYCTVFKTCHFLTMFKTPFEDAYKVEAFSRAFQTSPTYQASHYTIVDKFLTF